MSKTEPEGQKVAISRVIAIVLTIILIIALKLLPSSAEDLTYQEFSLYNLKPGDTLWSISKVYYKTGRLYRHIQEYNGIKEPRSIKPGQVIKVPHKIVYSIRRGDTLISISKKLLKSSRYHKHIAEYNNIQDPDRITPGIILTIPLFPSIEEAILEKRQKEMPAITEPKKSPEKEEKETVQLTKEMETKPEKEQPIKEEKMGERLPSEAVKEERPEKAQPEVEERPSKEVEAQEVKPKIEEMPPMPPAVQLEIKERPAIERKSREFIQKVEKEWPPSNPWVEKLPSEEKPAELEKLTELREAISRMSKAKPIPSLKEFRKEREFKERGVQLPMGSLLQIEGYKSVTIEYNKTHYFGKSDASKYRGAYSGVWSDYYGGYGYDYEYGSYGGYGGYGYSGYDSYYGGSYGYGYGYGGYGYGYGRDTGFNVEQEMVLRLHGRVGPKTHIDIDYNDTGRSQFGGMGQKEQKISVWYEGGKDEIIKKAALGDIQLNIPNSRFITMSRSLFGVQLVAEIAGVKLTAFGTRTKGIKGTWTSTGQSRWAGGGTGNRIPDINYIKERYYAINVGEDGKIHESYLPIESGSEKIYIDDGIGTNNDSGVATAQGYFDLLYPGDDYNIDYTTGQIEFLRNISSNFKIVVAYRYKGSGGGTVGNPEAMFVDDDNDGVIDEKDDPSDPVGYVVIKDTGQHGSELRNVYSLGNRNISRRNFDISIWRINGTENFQTDEGPVSYIRIFGLDSDGDGKVDEELIDFERGLLTFRTPRPFVIDDPASPYYKYRDQLNNEAIYGENPNYNDQKYIIQADYSYRTPSIYLGVLNIIPESEEVIVNGRKLRRGTDYIMIYEVGSVEIFRQLDEYDKIVINYEYMPFGGVFQQTIAGIWAEYSFTPKRKEPSQQRQEKPDIYDQTTINRSDFTPTTDSFGSKFDYNTYSYSSEFGSDSYSSMFETGYDYYRGYGSDYYGGYGGYYGGFDSYSRRGRFGGFDSSFTRRTTRYTYGGMRTGLNLSFGYIYNAGQRTLEIPDVNSAPARLQALVLNGSWGQEFNVARVFKLLPFFSVKGTIPLSLFLDIESAYSRNNPNSVGFAVIDSMEGAKESTRMPTYKFSWQLCSVPVDSMNGVNVNNRAIFRIVPKDKEASYGNYMKNRDTSAKEINPLSRSIEQRQVMEIGYDLDDEQSWGGLSHSISPTGSDFSDYEFLEIWIKVEGDRDINLNIDFGTLSEDSDDDFRLDSEDLPEDLIDTNGDHKIDILDLNKENLPPKDRYKGNGRLDSGEDIGFSYDYQDRTERIYVGKENSVLDSEDLDGDMILDAVNSYYEFTVPLNSIPPNWIRRENRETGWMFLNIPIEEALPKGRSPSWQLIKHSRIWLEKNTPGRVMGRLQWYSLALVGNKWEKGLLVDETGKLTNKENEYVIIGTKNNFEFDDYLKEYRTIENNKDFRDLHPYIESAFNLGEDRLEQSLTINYRIEPKTTAYTMRLLQGQRRGDGQDFSKHENIRIWIHGDGSKSTFIMRLGSNVDDFGAGSPITRKQQEEQYPGAYQPYSYYSYSRFGGRGYYEFTMPIDFIGWRLITIPLEDKNGDGHPDSLKPVNDPTINNITQILVGLRNDNQSSVEGEVWINDIHLNSPKVRSGWARRFSFYSSLANILDLRADYARQDKEFENSAGQTGRSMQYSMGYSTSNYDYNFSTEFKLIPWLPVSYEVSHRETESVREYGMISSYMSGKTKTDNRTISVFFDRAPLPSLSFSQDRQNSWNERRGNELSKLYSSNLKYSIKNILSINMNYSHESLNLDSRKSGSESLYDSYYYGSGRDSIIDSGGISLQISPSKDFGINPSYDVRRELEREISKEGKEGKTFKIVGRDQRFSIRPTLRQFWMIRPTMGGRYSFSEDWLRGEKDATINTNLNFGINVNFKNFFNQRRSRASQITTAPARANDQTATGSDSSNPYESSNISPEMSSEMLEERFQKERGNWIESEKDELKRRIERQGMTTEKKGILERSIESFTLNTDFGLDISDYLRQLKPDMGFFDILKLEPESKYRSRSSRNKRVSVRTSIEPFTWSSIGLNLMLTNRFSKSMGTTSNADSTTLGGDIKLSKNTLSLMLKYDLTTQDISNRSGNISNSISHNPSITFRNNWKSGIGTSFGTRTTFRIQERSGVKTKSLIIAPNFNIDYDLHVSGNLKVPFTKKTIRLDHDLDMSNTFSTMIRREKLGVNRDEKSEQYGTSIDISYNLRQTIRSTLRLSIDYNHDHVREGADYLSISGSLMMRGEFK